MLFNSHEFLFAFLPIALLGFWWLARLGRRAALAWLTFASLVFYGWWNPAFLGVLLASLIGNYWMGRALSASHPTGWSRRGLLTIGVVANLVLLGYFKYALFLLENLNRVFGSGYALPDIVLPLGISFFTFQQIAFLVDTSRGEEPAGSFMDYCLFVTFFPQLIAGPIVHPKEMLPQFRVPDVFRPQRENLEIGLTIFFIGLFKKTVLADGIAPLAAQAFGAAEQGLSLSFLEAWCGALAYTLQLYFDFSGYSDMAIGLGRLFGIRLPLNFHSPYQAVNIIDFWRRWHMTLSRFLRDYLYIPLGGSRKGMTRRYVNLMVTMLLGGLWHGAGWTFVLWGGLHGFYLCVNHGWHACKRWLGWSAQPMGWTIWPARLLTFAAVVVGWVLFRAESLAGASSMLSSLAGLNGLILPERLFGQPAWLANWSGWVQFGTLPHCGGSDEVLFGAALLALAWFAPNTQQILAQWNPAWEPFSDPQERPCPRWLLWEPNDRWAIALSAVTVIAVLQMSRVSEFLYFQF